MRKNTRLYMGICILISLVILAVTLFNYRVLFGSKNIIIVLDTNLNKTDYSDELASNLYNLFKNNPKFTVYLSQNINKRKTEEERIDFINAKKADLVINVTNEGVNEIYAQPSGVKTSKESLDLSNKISSSLNSEFKVYYLYFEPFKVDKYRMVRLEPTSEKKEEKSFGILEDVDRLALSISISDERDISKEIYQAVLDYYK